MNVVDAVGAGIEVSLVGEERARIVKKVERMRKRAIELIHCILLCQLRAEIPNQIRGNCSEYPAPF